MAGDCAEINRGSKLGGNLKTGEMPTLAAAASKLGSRGNQGAVRSVANQMKLKTGEMRTLAAAASELGSRGNQGAFVALLTR